MKKASPILILIFTSLKLFAPPNCEVYTGNEKCYEACEEAYMAIRYKQGSYQSQIHFDKSIELCPDFAYSYMEKAVPYLKRGLFIEWKALIDKAVEISPSEYLGYRGWCRLQFLRDYDGAIQDIERLKSLVNYDIGYCQTGDYHLDIVLALCYKQKGNFEKAREIFLEHLGQEDYSPGMFDYYHYGVLAYESGHYETALRYLDQQQEENDLLAETYYYKALTNKKLGNIAAYNENLKIAEEYYRAANFRTDTYTEPLDKVYLVEVLEEMGGI
jgi:tetratricopeptide (TPR) repeat protein